MIDCRGAKQSTGNWQGRRCWSFRQPSAARNSSAAPITGDEQRLRSVGDWLAGDDANCRGLPDHVGSLAAIGYRRLLSIAGERTGYLGNLAVIAGNYLPRDCFS